MLSHTKKSSWPVEALRLRYVHNVYILVLEYIHIYTYFYVSVTNAANVFEYLNIIINSIIK